MRLLDAGHHDAVWSGLSWYTDLDAANAHANAQGTPIVSRRLLGKLTDEYSCADSRFFRTALHANTAVSKLLGESVVLAWGSERPKSVVTIDFGDGRIFKRTLTGNNIHYILDRSGVAQSTRVHGALPHSAQRPMARAGARFQLLRTLKRRLYRSLKRAVPLWPSPLISSSSAKLKS